MMNDPINGLKEQVIYKNIQTNYKIGASRAVEVKYQK